MAALLQISVWFDGCRNVWRIRGAKSIGIQRGFYNFRLHGAAREIVKFQIEKNFRYIPAVFCGIRTRSAILFDMLYIQLGNT